MSAVASSQLSTPSSPKITAVKVVGSPKTNFRQWGLDYGRVLTDDYVHKKLLTVKYTGKGNRFNFNGKETLDLKQNADKKEIPSVSGETKLITNIEGKNIETKFDSKGVIRTWANWGEFNLSKPVQILTKVKTNDKFDKVSGWLAGEYKGKQLDANIRFDLKNTLVPYYNQKLIFHDKDVQAGIATKVNLKTFGLRRYNAFASYALKDMTFFLEHVSQGQEKETFNLGKLIFATLYKHGKNQYVVRASYRPQKKDDHFRFVVGTHQKINDNFEARAKLDSHLKLALSSKYKVCDNLSIVAGTNVNLKEPSSFLTHRLIPINLGLSVEFSYN